jgi:hypothetical protein
MTYAVQLKDYEDAVIAKRLGELQEDEVKSLKFANAWEVGVLLGHEAEGRTGAREQGQNILTRSLQREQGKII